MGQTLPCEFLPLAHIALFWFNVAFDNVIVYVAIDWLWKLVYTGN